MYYLAENYLANIIHSNSFWLRHTRSIRVSSVDGPTVWNTLLARWVATSNVERGSGKEDGPGAFSLGRAHLG